MPVRIKRHIDWLKELPMLPFSLLVAGYSFFARIIPALLAIPFVLATGAEAPSHFEVSWWLALIVGPVIETIMFQWFLIWITSRFTSRTSILVGVSAVLFSAAHYDGAFLSALAVIPSGIALAWAFVLYRDRGIRPALFVTTLIHMWTNLIVMGLRLIVD